AADWRRAVLLKPSDAAALGSRAHVNWTPASAQSPREQASRTIHRERKKVRDDTLIAVACPALTSVLQKYSRQKCTLTTELPVCYEYSEQQVG
ncbi:hypothetical protein DNTS_008588, partial [Danionella cerebrum]